MIADHLDRILAAGEDLTKLTFTVHGREPDDTVNAFVRRCRDLEFSAVAALLRAREHARELGRYGTDFAPLARLFAAQTVAITDAVDQMSDRQAVQFNGQDPLEFFRTRGLLETEAGCLMTVERIDITEDFLIAGAIHLGALMDMSAALLDALEVHFDLFPPLDADLPDQAATASGSAAL
ncbi:MAG: hypothetical protein KDJ36_09520 [Hyphomicrobiaceae bacterium]|nr:hypothetical protein [Hyphomicrobiaceae bacterium]